MAIGRAAKAAVVLGLGLVGCTPDFEKISEVKDLRILAVRADPQEQLVLPGSTAFGPVRIDALVVDPRAPAELVDWELSGCTAEDQNCDEATYKVRLASGRGRLDAIRAELPFHEQLAQQALKKDPFRGFGGVPVLVELRVKKGSEEVWAIKRVVYGYTQPLDKAPNRNPSLARVKADDREPVAGWTVKPEAEVKLLPEPAPDAKEKYRVLTFSGGSRTLDEFLTYSFFATRGALKDNTTGGKPSPFVTNRKVDEVFTTWKAPKELGLVTLWVVVRDDRGGVGWWSATVEVK
ncbi:MAG: hypothetical protein IT371_05090 [Deltaproteobacteria bacterium]|nr:hypothetical protein [Deltaproteobacteria bacterium]